MYPSDWHRIFGDMTGISAQRILPDLIKLFGVRSVVEVGCGNAHWTQVARESGVDEYTVVDGPWNLRKDLLVEKSRFLEADLALPLQLGRRFDMAICLEVAEHVRAESADILVASLAAASDVILFGAAIPLQGGYGHINEQWPSWWRDKLDAAGYEAFDLVRPRHWRDQSIHYWYRQNSFVYVKRGCQSTQVADQAAKQIGQSSLIFDAIHPEKYDEMASYRTIALSRLVRRFPAWFTKRVRQKITGKDA
jgi:SAM-dependent methyltransferase